jgi:Cu2+-containing amine oxidase
MRAFIARATAARAIALAAVLLASAAGPAGAQACSAPYLVQQTFTRGTYSTEWTLCWSTPSTYGLTVTAAYFRPGPGKPLIKIFSDARVTDIFVPYHAGSPRFYDLSEFDFPMMTLTSADCPAAAGGTLLGNPAVVCKEVKDRGLAWKMSDGRVYRGREVVLWSALQAANYVYVFRWRFRDDGVVVGEIAATGTNLPGIPTQAHMHNATWRLDIDLNGAGGDNAMLLSHVESGAAAVDSQTVIPTERGLAWNGLRFNALHIFDSQLRNSRGHTSGFMLMPDRTGTSRHQETWTQRDLWVTAQDPSQMRPSGLPGYVSANRSVSNTDIVVWYTGSVHHMFRDEDGRFSGGTFSGATQAMWASFMLKPHNLFDGPPFWP